MQHNLHLSRDYFSPFTFPYVFKWDAFKQKQSQPLPSTHCAPVLVHMACTKTSSRVLFLCQAQKIGIIMTSIFQRGKSIPRWFMFALGHPACVAKTAFYAASLGLKFESILLFVGYFISTSTVMLILYTEILYNSEIWLIIRTFNHLLIGPPCNEPFHKENLKSHLLTDWNISFIVEYIIIVHKNTHKCLKPQ